MSNEIIISLLSLFGTIFGSTLGIITSNRLTIYRIKQLEEKVSKHNSLIERMAIVERDVKSAHRRLDELLEDLK